MIPLQCSNFYEYYTSYSTCIPQQYGSHRRQRRFLRFSFVPTLPYHTIVVAVVVAVVAAVEVAVEVEATSLPH